MEKTAETKSGKKKQNWFQRAWAGLNRWFREMKSELKKVVWPTPKTLAKNSVVSVVFMLVSALVLWGADMIASLAVNLLFRIAG